jgi:hypothetical protein
MTNIKIVRLSTGEELICEVVKTESSKLNLKDIAILIPTQQNQLGLAPFMAYSQAANGMEIEESFIMFMVDPVDDLKSQWQTMFSRVLTAPSKIII